MSFIIGDESFLCLKFTSDVFFLRKEYTRKQRVDSFLSKFIGSSLVTISKFLVLWMANFTLMLYVFIFLWLTWDSGMNLKSEWDFLAWDLQL